MSKATQSNTRIGDFRVLAGQNLTDKEGLLVKLTHDTGVPEVKLPAAVTDFAIYVLTEGGADESLVTVKPLENGQNVRLKLSGTCNPGDLLVPAAIDGTKDGMVNALPAEGGTYRGIAIAEEKGVNGQLVLARPCMLSNVTVLDD
jgi:hypothetical protein